MTSTASGAPASDERPGLLADPVATLRLRRAICVATIVACLPYTLLKVVWVLGWGVGSNEAGFADTTRGANGVTGFLDLVAIVLAILLVHPVGRRIPAFLVAGPLWIGVGLLTPVAGGFVLGSITQLVTGGGSPVVGEGQMSGWVFLVVYGGFVGQAVLLAAGFGLYVRERWPGLLAGGRAHDGAGPTRPLQNLLGWVFLPAALGYAAICGRWAITGGGRFSDPSTAQSVMLVVLAALAIMGAVACTALIRGQRLHRRWLVGGFVGTGVVFADALSSLVVMLVSAPGEWGHGSFTAGESVALLFIAFCALGAGIGGALRFVEEQRPVPQPA